MNSKSKIAKIAYENERLTISVELAADDILRGLIVDDVRRDGTFVGSKYGWVYEDAAGVPGLGGLGFGASVIDVRRAPISNPKATTNLVGGVFVPDPPSTFGSGPLDPLVILGHLYDVGFHDDMNLLGGLAVTAGESGFYPQARNWLPSDGFRPAATVLGVQGPAAAWNKAHTEQGESDRGLFQFNSAAFPKILDSQTDDPAQACAAVFVVTKGGKDWSPWGFGQGLAHYSPFFDGKVHGIGPLRPIVTAFLATK